MTHIGVLCVLVIILGHICAASGTVKIQNFSVLEQFFTCNIFENENYLRKELTDFLL